MDQGATGDGPPDTNAPDANGPGADAGAVTGNQKQFLSGTRIKACTINTADGAQGFVGWFDAELGAPCSFATAADGTTRCLPGGVLIAGNFLDANCSQPVLLGLGTCAAPDQYGTISSATCPARSTVYSGLVEVTPDEGQYWIRLTDGCYSQPVGAYHVYTGWTAVNPGTFAEGTFDVD